MFVAPDYDVAHDRITILDVIIMYLRANILIYINWIHVVRHIYA